MPVFPRQRRWTILRKRSFRAGARVVGRLIAELLFGCALASAILLSAKSDDGIETSGTWQRLTSNPSHAAGSLSCASATCHGQAQSDNASSTRAGDEYLTWFEHDPHARAARTLDSVEFQRILATVSGAPADSSATRAVYRQCAACHDPEGLSSVNAYSTVAATEATLSGGAGGRGIGCESCHGHAEQWLSRHYERGAQPRDLARLGLRDLNDLVLRGRVCAGCHVGDDDHDMNHDMIAAGHPPLRFELSAYHDLIRHKHWFEGERVRNADFKLDLWAAGQVAVADATFGLTASRAMRATSTRTAVEHKSQSATTDETKRVVPWPEFAEYDCFACHQRLRPVVEAPPGGVRARTDRSRALVGWQTWNLPLQGPGTRWLAEPRDARSNRENAGPWILAIDKLRGEMSDLQHADPARVASLANDTREALRRKFSRRSVATASDTDTPDATSTVEAAGVSAVWPLVGRPNASRESWADACQEWLLLRSAFLSIADSLDPARRERLERQFREIAQSLSFGSTQIEWPAYDWSGLPARDARSTPLRDLPSIAAALESLAAELQSLRGVGPVRENTSSP